MIGVNIGDNGDAGKQVQERPVRLISLKDHVLALPYTRIGGKVQYLTADNRCWIDASVIQHIGEH